MSANSTADAAYRAIVSQLAAGQIDPELSAVQAALAAAGKTTNDLRADVSGARQQFIRKSEALA